MPIRIPAHLPGRKTLETERIPLILEERAIRQDIRPLQIALMNLMPDKIQTETQILRALGRTPLQIEITLIHPASHKSKNTPAAHLQSFYQTYDDVKDRYFDGMIMTGAPLAHLDFESVTYWNELCRVMDWARAHVYSCFFICWGAQAAMKHFYGIEKRLMKEKQCGVFPHRTLDPFDALTAGFDNIFNVPVSRYAEITSAEIKHCDTLDVMAESDITGLCLLQDRRVRHIFMLNHLEYETETLKREYERDVNAGINPAIPYNYFPDDDPSQPPAMTWRAHRNLLFHNWVNMVYQGTPFVLETIKDMPDGWE